VSDELVDASPGERIERSNLGRVIISVVIVAAMLAQVAAHLPDGSALEDDLGPSGRYLVRLAGIESQWGVFAPNPRSTSLKLEGRVTFEDGSTATWHLPEGARIGANLRYYRWRKWLERVRADDYRNLWEPTCQWIASLYEWFDSPVESVQLVRLFHENHPTGDQPPYDEFVYHTCSPREGGS
jgi:hypothetical protein